MKKYENTAFLTKIIIIKICKQLLQYKHIQIIMKKIRKTAYLKNKHNS